MINSNEPRATMSYQKKISVTMMALMILLVNSFRVSANDNPRPPINLVVNSALCFSAMDNNPAFDQDGIAGQITVNSLVIQNGGSINYNDPGNPCSNAGGSNDGAQPIKIIVTNNMEIQAGGFISTDNKISSGNAGNIVLQVGGTFIMRGPSGPAAGAIISATTAGTSVGINGGKISINAGNTTLEAGSIVRSEAAKGAGGNIDLTITGTFNMNGGNPGAKVSSSNTAGNGAAGAITLHVSGNINLAPGSMLWANSGTGTAGMIEIVGNSDVDIDGLVYSHSGGSGTGTAPNCNFAHGGFITISASKNLVVSDDGQISSKSNDPGADLVHLCGCNVTVYGLVESTGAGHALPCVNFKTHLVPPYRPDKPVNITAGVEIWAGDKLIIDNATHFGLINASLTSGQSNTSWVDLFAKNDITIIGSTDALDPFAVRANNGGAGNVAGTITIKSFNQRVIASGRAIQANGAFGGSGGTIVMQGKNNVDISNAALEAIGATHNGGTMQLRSFNGDIISTGGVAGTTMNVSGPTPGSVTLTECGTAAFNGTKTPPPNPVPVTGTCGGAPVFAPLQTYVVFCECTCTTGSITITKVVLGTPPNAPWQFASNIPGHASFTLPAAGGSVTFSGIADGPYTVTETNQLVPNTQLFYVPSNTCGQGTTASITMANCQALTCTFTNQDPSYCQWCSKSAVLSQVRQNMGDQCAKPDIIVDLRLGTTTVDPSKVGTDQPATGSLQAAIDYMNNNDTNDGNNDGDFNGDGKLFIGVIATDCENTPTACAPVSRPPAGDSPHGTENVIVTNLHSGRMNIFGCSVTIWAADPSKPVITVQNSVGKVTILDIHVKYSNVEGYLVKNNSDLVVVKNGRAMFNDIGYRLTGSNIQVTGAPQISNNRIGIEVDGNGNILRTNSDIRDNSQLGIYLNNGAGSGNETNGNEVGVSGHPNGVGMRVSGNNNDMHDDNVSRNTGNGIEVSGNSNELHEEDVNYNGGHGFWISGNNNIVTGNDQTKNNVGDGIRVTGDNNDLEENTAENNGGHGINADNANGADNNTLKKNEANDNTLQGIRACGQIDQGNNKGQDNGLDPQVSFVCPNPANAKFIVTDIGTDKAYKYDATFNLVSSSVLTANNADPNDVADNGSNTYVLDKSDKLVYRYVGSTVASRVLKENGGGSLSSPSGIAISGNDMWVADGSKKKIYKYSLSAAFTGAGVINATMEIPFTGSNGSAEGLAIDASYLYVLDDSKKEFFRYPLAGGAGVASKVLKDIGGSSLSSPTGTVIDGSSIWVVDGSKQKAYQYNMASLGFAVAGNVNASNQYPLYSLNQDATGLATGTVANFPARTVSEPTTVQPEDQPTLIAFPNPATDRATIQFDLTHSGQFVMSLVNESGRVVMSEMVEGHEGINIRDINLHQLPRGMYLLVLKSNNEKLQKRLLVE